MPIEPFDKTIHDREAFTCGVEGVDRYFQTIAQQAANRYISQTFVLVPADPRPERCEVVGYFTLVQHAYRDGEMDETTAKALKVKRAPMIPMILLGQLGVAKSHQGNGVGSALLRHALRRCLCAALLVGAVAVITDPINERAASFYCKNGFKKITPTDHRLLIPTPVIARYNPDIMEQFKVQRRPVDITFTSQDFTA